MIYSVSTGKTAPKTETKATPCKVGEKTNLHFIKGSTGCSCCSNENFSQGPYINLGDAEAQVKQWLEGPAPAPVSSQYASRGNYSIETHEAERISNNRFIIGTTVVTIPDYDSGIDTIGIFDEEFPRDEIA